MSCGKKEKKTTKRNEIDYLKKRVRSKKSEVRWMFLCMFNEGSIAFNSAARGS